MRTSLFVLIAAAIACRADRPSETTLALGYHTGAEYRTTLFDLSPEGARILGDVAGIVVHRPGGFTRLGTTVRCTDHGTEEVIWQTAIDRQPDVAGACGDGVAPGEDASRGCSQNTARIEFVSPGYMSQVTTIAQTEECEPRGGRWHDSMSVRPLGSGHRVDLGELFGNGAAAAYDSALQAGFRAMEAEGWNCPYPTPESYDLASWTIGHVRGAWRPMAATNTDIGECEVVHEIALALPDSLTGEGGPSITFEELAKNVAALGDYAASPGGEYILVLPVAGAPDTAALYTMKANRLDRELLRLPKSLQRLVMTRWATGDEAKAWKAMPQ